MTGSNQDKSPPMRQQIIDLATEAFTGGRDDGERTYLVQKDGPNIALYGKTAKNAVAGEL
jgi:hypothetical protein